MTGSLQIKGGKYYVVVRYKDEFGKLKQKWIGINLEAKGNKTKAKEKMKEILKNFNPEQIKTNIVNPNDDILFLDYFEQWLPLRKDAVAITTYRNYQRYYKKIKAYFKNMNLKLKDLKPFHLEGFYKSMYDKKRTSNTVLHYHTLIRLALKYAVINDLITSNVADKVERPKKGNFKGSFYSIEEIEKLFSCLDDKNECSLAIMLTAMYGLRRSETLGIKWKAIDFEKNMISIEHKIIVTKVDEEHKQQIIPSDTLKNKTSNRVLPLLPQAKIWLMQAKQKQLENQQKLGKLYNKDFLEYVCVDNLGNLILPDRLGKSFARVLKRNKLRKIRFHDLRHSCASIMLANGVPMKQIQEWLGHADFSTTANIYAHLDYSSKLDSANTISKAFENITPQAQQSIIELEEDEESIELTDEELEEELERLMREREERERRKRKEKDFEM